jgi:hypothetical protein
MDLSNIQPITNEPALFIKNKKILVIADLHIGIETELRELGLNTASQTDVMTKHLISLYKRYKPEEIVLLGDIKHNIPSSTIQERRDVTNFLETIQSYAKTRIIPGNHDGNIKKITPTGITISPSDGFIFENIGFVHGHRWPSQEVMQCEQIIMGHTHPTVTLTDRLGYKTHEPCWLKTQTLKDKIKEKYSDYNEDIQILAIPAFNSLCGGIATNKDGVTGPVGKIMNIDNAKVYLLDGSAIGRVKDIK